MTESEPPQIIELRAPTQCVLWEHPERLPGKFAELFETIETYDDDSHLSRSLHKCRECGQLYFYEWYEWVDWDGGNDKSYSTLVPVQTQEEIDALKESDIFNLMCYFPRLHLDPGKASWNGKR